MRGDGFVRFLGQGRGRRAPWFVAMLALCWVAVPGPLAAADAQEDELNRQGVEARKRDDDLAAIELFRKAYNLHHSPRGAAQMGLAEIALGRWTDAETHLQEALSSPHDPWIQKNQQVLRESLERVQNQFGTLQILGSPVGAEVVVEGRVLGRLPMEKPARVRTGDCRFEVRAPGYASAMRTVAIESGIPRRETVELSASGPASEPRAATPAVAKADEPSTEVAQPSAPTRPLDDDTSAHHARLRTVGIVLGAAGLAAVGAGVVFGVFARSAGTNNSQTGNTFDPNADSSGKSYQTLQYVGYGVGASLLVAGTVTFLMGLDSDQPPPATGVAIVPLRSTGAALALTGTF